jgi:beta-1,4-mannosyltransferase
LVAALISFFRRSRLVIDWHNFGYSILALRLGPSHPLVTISKRYERFFARQAYAHLAVTHAMVRVLRDDFKVSAIALHDRPAAQFQPLSPAKRAYWLARLPPVTQHERDMVEGKWRLLVSSTSWTPDEDFSILLSALQKYSARASSFGFPDSFGHPKILVVITGKGPQKEHYLAEIKRLNKAKLLENVIVTTAWLSSEEYAALLGCADLGVSLHTSSSGVDLPMKVVDMFGAGLPVVGWSKFEAWPELVQENTNGMGFESAQGLADLLEELFGAGSDKLRILKQGAVREGGTRWDDEWDPVAGKLFES